MDFVAIDFETANEKRSSPCSVGVVVMADGKVAETFYTLIKPKECRFSEYNTYIHGITAENVQDKPEFPEVWLNLKKLIETGVVVAHHASFDMSVLRGTLGEYELTFPEITYSCTRIIAKATWPGLANYRLDTVAGSLNIEFEHHHALADARACAEITCRACEKTNSHTLDDLAEHLKIRHGQISKTGNYSPPGRRPTTRSRNASSRIDIHVMRKWYDDDATNRQIKVLKFFGEFLGVAITKGAASRIITRIFMIHENRELWLKYVFLTGDRSQDSPDLAPFDPAELEAVVVPDDWKPHGSKIKRKTGFERERLFEMVTDILKEGIPLDDPVPQIEYQGKNFCCTGKFQFGSRVRCNDAITHMGGCPQKNVTLETNYLIVGAELSQSWAHESYGNKIKKALIYKLEGQPVAIVAEEDWSKTIRDIQQ